MNLKNIVITTAFVLFSGEAKHSIVESEEQLYEALSAEEDLSDIVPIFSIADVLAQGNKYRTGVFQENLFREDAEYLTETISFKKSYKYGENRRKSLSTNYRPSLHGSQTRESQKVGTGGVYQASQGSKKTLGPIL